MSINKKYLFSCISLSLFLCFSQIRASTMLTLGGLGIYLVLLGWACTQNQTLPILLFFLPWSPLMRTSPDSLSFFTFGLVLSCGISVFRNGLHLKQYALLTGICVLLVTLVSKLLDGNSLEFSYIAFLMMLVVLPSVKQETYRGTYDFYQLTVFYALGVIIAALCAMSYAGYANIAQYIRVDQYNVVLRRCGFYADPNFYTAQITAAVGGCMVLLLQETRRSRTLLLLILTFLLIYCGAMSGSKSFALVTASLVLVWLYNLMRIRRRAGMKTILLLALAVIAAVVATSDMFRDLIDVIVVRFSRTTDLNSFTTDRLELWERYLGELFSDSKVFFLGRGYTNVKINDRGSHNTIIQTFHQFGIVGAPFLIYWLTCFLRDAPSGWRKTKETRRNALIVILGVYMPWLAIDILFFDDFFLLQWYAFMAMYETSQPKKKTLPRYPAPPVTKPAGGTLRNTIHE